MIPGTIPVGNFVNTFGARTVSFVTTDYIDGEEDSSCSFTGVSLSTASSNRWIIVGICGLMTNEYSASTITSCTVNGYTASIVVQDFHTGDRAIAGIAVAYCPTGTTGTIVVNFNSAIDSCHIAVWKATGLVRFAPYDSDTDTSGTMSFSLDTLSNGFIIAVGTSDDTFIGPATWTNLTERYDSEKAVVTPGRASFHTVTGADTTTSGSPVTITLSIANQDDRVLVAASF